MRKNITLLIFVVMLCATIFSVGPFLNVKTGYTKGLNAWVKTNSIQQQVESTDFYEALDLSGGYRFTNLSFGVGIKFSAWLDSEYYDPEFNFSWPVTVYSFVGFDFLRDPRSVLGPSFGIGYNLIEIDYIYNTINFSGLYVRAGVDLNIGFTNSLFLSSFIGAEYRIFDTYYEGSTVGFSFLDLTFNIGIEYEFDVLTISFE